MAGRGGGYSKPSISTGEEAPDDFEDIVDSPYGAAGAELLSGDGEDEDFTIAADSAADAAFDRQVEVLQEVVLDDAFQALLGGYCKEHCHHFEDTEENKLIYTELFQKYSDQIEGYLEEKLTGTISGFSMQVFLEELMRRGEEEIDGAVFDLLVSLADFDSFKQQMLEAKDGSKQTLAVSGRASQLHMDEDEDGEARPDIDQDLANFLTVSPATPSKKGR